MNRLPFALLPAAFLLPLGACVAAPPGPPPQVAQAIARDLDAGKADDAHALFERVRSSSTQREEIYPILYDQARQRWAAGEYAGAAALFRFLTEEYPAGGAAREGLVYSLFLERAQSDVPDVELSAELARRAAEVRSASADPPPWLDLIDAQLAIDRGRLPEARASLDRFRGEWNGQPTELVAYVDDLGRYLGSHGTPEGNGASHASQSAR